MTKQQEAEVIRVCGENYELSDIPAFLREEKQFENEMNLISELDRVAEEYEAEKYDYHPHWSEEEN